MQRLYYNQAVRGLKKHGGQQSSLRRSGVPPIVLRVGFRRTFRTDSIAIDLVRLTILIIIQVLFLTARPGAAQDIARGVTWERPASTIRAAEDLRKMSEHGIKAVRTGAITEKSILEAADSLGITLFRELPFYEYPAGRLVDSTAGAQKILAELIRSGAGHPSAGPIGLAVRADVSDPSICSYFSDVVGVAEKDETGPHQSYYYVGSFVESDVCSSSVDFVILDAIDAANTADVLRRWAAAGNAAAGITAGGWVDMARGTGLQVPNSAESQARSIEISLQELSTTENLIASFVHRWRDQLSGSPPSLLARGDVYGRYYGLHDENDTPRLSLNVLTGFLTGGQDTFAFARNPDEPGPPVWYLLMGWMLIGIVAALYASSPRFRYMAPRYFIAHGFYRNAVREAREVLPIVSTALLTIVGITIGMIATQFLIAVHDTAPVVHAVRLLPVVLQAALTVLIESPIIATFFLGSIALLAMALWMGIWMIVALRKAPLLSSQALMLAVWPRWQLLLLLPVTMSIHTLDPESMRIGMLAVFPFWIGSSLWGGARTAYDVFKLTRCSLAMAIFGWILHPTVLLILALSGMALAESDHFAYIIHLAVRS